ncbi:MAG: hypothetical protein ABL864_13485 [Terricaulis sp.]
MADFRTSLALLAPWLLTFPAAAATLEDAQAAYRDNHVNTAEEMLAALVLDASATEPDRAAAQRELARIDWLMRGETDAAASALGQVPTGEERCRTATLALRIFREADMLEGAISPAQEALGSCAIDDAEALHLQLARAYLSEAERLQDRRAELLDESHAQLDALSPSARTTPSASAVRFSAALARRDAGAALAAWRDYFWLTESDAPQAMNAYAGRVQSLLAAGLAPQASDAGIVSLVELLIRAGFAADARQLAADMRLAERTGEDPAWKRLAAYLAFDEAVGAATLRANRELAGGGHAPWYESEIMSAMGALMSGAGLSGDPRAALAEAFGLYGTIGETSGYPSLHAGHLVQDEHARIEQYGQSAELRFIAIDNMISNGFESWLWDGWAEAGGWAPDNATIVQVRSAYTDGPISALRRVRPGPARERFLARIEAAAPSERAALANGAIASLTATSDRLELQALNEIAAHTGASDEAFLAEHWRASLQHSIFNHEGRHVLDKARHHGLGSLSDTELEYRAKLSELALSDYPRLALSNISGGARGDTPHGRANTRVLRAIKRWMHSHRREIAGLDSAAPELSQLQLLSNDQIRVIARDLDPIAR